PSAQALNHVTLGDQRSAGGAITAVAAVADHGIPAKHAGARVQSVDVRVSGGDVDLVVVHRQPALGIAGGIFAQPVLPDQFAGLGVQGLHDVGGIVEEDGAAMDDGRGLVRTVRHGPYPLQLQILHVGRRNLVQSAVVGGLVVAADHDPIIRILRL